MNRAIFFDRDGTLNPLVSRPDGRNTSPWTLDEFSFLPNVREAIALVAPHYQCFIVTNQPHVGHEMTEADLHHINAYIQRELPGIVDIAYATVPGNLYYKPGHGMINHLITKHRLVSPASKHYMVGDRWKDIVCGFAARVQTIFVGDKYDHGGWETIQPDYMVSDVYAACELIMEKHHAESRLDRRQ